jgi:SdpC family antimicrobial peptide
MSIFNRMKRRWRLGAVLAVATSLAVAYALPGQASAETSRVPAFSAVPLADAVLFQVGPAAQYVKSLNPDPHPWTEAMTASQRAVDAYIERDPKWGAVFARRLQSGDPVQVDRALADLGSLTRRALNDTFGRERIDDAIRAVNDAIIKERLLRASAIDFENAMDVGSDVWIETDVAVAVEVVVAVVVAVVLVVAWDLPDEMAKVAQLQKELIVKTVAEKLQVGAEVQF